MLNTVSLPDDLICSVERHSSMLGSRLVTSPAVLLMVIELSKGVLHETLIDKFGLRANKVFAASIRVKRLPRISSKVTVVFETLQTPGVAEAFRIASERASVMLRDFQKDDDICRVTLEDILVGLLRVNDLDLQRVSRKLDLNVSDLLDAIDTEQAAFVLVE